MPVTAHTIKEVTPRAAYAHHSANEPPAVKCYQRGCRAIVPLSSRPPMLEHHAAQHRLLHILTG